MKWAPLCNVLPDQATLYDVFFSHQICIHLFEHRKNAVDLKRFYSYLINSVRPISEGENQQKLNNLQEKVKMVPSLEHDWLDK